MLVEFAESPVRFNVLGEIALHTTVTCPNMRPFFYPLNTSWVIGFGTVNLNGAIQGRFGTNDVYCEWNFRRPEWSIGPFTGRCMTRQRQPFTGLDRLTTC
jgi:hypothetical protein